MAIRFCFGANKGYIEEVTGMTKGAIDRAIDRLIKSEKIEKYGMGRYREIGS